ncbi:MAG: hypothetical protein NTV08_12245 [Verrucomicrobia bacterium]|nr:hypothetical protein [Verrucomicrobiota bacterium]
MKTRLRQLWYLAAIAVFLVCALVSAVRGILRPGKTARLDPARAHGQ